MWRSLSSLASSGALLSLFLLSAGCDCTGPVGDVCEDSVDCPSGFECRDGRCMEELDPIDAGPSEVDAGDCPAAQACGDECCPGGQTCTGGACCAVESACGDTCCGAGDSCTAGVCCSEEQQCGGACCPADHVCEANACRLVCDADRAPCGDAASAQCCEVDDVCLVGACVTPGRECSPTERCDEGEYCESTLGRCLPVAMTSEECTYEPPVGAFEPVVEWSWVSDPDVLPNHQQVMMAPMVANLDDDNGDGVIDELDIPDVLFNTFSGGVYYDDGVLRAVRGDDGARLWPTADPGYRTHPGSGIAVAEADASSPGPEVFTCSTRDSGVTCCDGVAGRLLMISAAGELLRRFDDVYCGYSAPVVGDMDGDGTVEIAVRHHIVHPDGTTVANIAARATTAVIGAADYHTMADLDGDGDLELVGGNAAFHHDGTPLWERTDLSEGYPAVADVDMDGRPEVVVVSGGSHSIRALNGEDGTDLWGPADVNQGVPTPSGPTGGGPPTIADFDGDGRPEIATAGGYGYVVFEAENGAPKWFRPTVDVSSRSTGSSVFDFDGDGAAEVVYNDEQFLRVYDGNDGTILLEECSTSGTLWEFPVIVDVDNDDHAEIIVMSNNYGGQTCADGSPGRQGIRIYGDAEERWVRTRRVWNSHTYHVTNVGEDLAIPPAERANWEVPGLNNFRQNVQPDGVLDAPDLVVTDLSLDTSRCPGQTWINLRVLNRGRAGAPAGIPVEVFDADPAGSPTAIASVTTTRRLLPGESEAFYLQLSLTLVAGQPSPIWLTVNSGPARLENLRECREGNNESTLELLCPGLQ